MVDGTITWGELVSVVSKDLASEQEARWLCEHASGMSSAEFASAMHELVGERSGKALREMVARRLTGEPLQYVMKRWAFRHLDVLVDERVLIPRPETEIVVQTAIELARETMRTSKSKLRIADLGTGSGVIGLSLAGELPRGSTEVWLTDLSADALEVAGANLAGSGFINSDVRIAQGSWFAALPGELKNGLDLVVSNPPYISRTDTAVEKIVRDYEPDIALFAENDGMSAHEQIVTQAQEWLVHGGWLVLEIGHDQGDKVRALLGRNGFKNVQIHQDLAHRDRIAVGQK